MNIKDDPITAYDGVLKGVAELYEKPFITSIRKTLLKFRDAEVEGALNRNQIQCKKWLVESLAAVASDLGTVFLLGGWYGTLGSLLQENRKFKIKEIHSIDLDPSCAKIALSLNAHLPELGLPFHAWTGDVYTLNLKHPEKSEVKDADGKSVFCQAPAPNLVVNTVCEHLPSMPKWLEGVPDGTLLVLQSNNFEQEPTHINCVASLEEFKKQVNIKQILFEGVLSLKKYDRYMLIGRK
jgi:hypothetical protein